MLTENQMTNTPSVNALLSLMCFHASRFEARLDKNGEPVLYEDQDENLWNMELIGKGAYYLHQASGGKHLSKYHLEAAIAWWTTQKNDTPEKWGKVLELYNQLLQIEYSPIAALNRTFAISKVNGKRAAIEEAEELHLTGNPFYYSLLGELYDGINNEKARENLRQALSLVKTDSVRLSLLKRLNKL
jgi:RNA polymerase sigma-70 factor (ECF subfamily)